MARRINLSQIGNFSQEKYEQLLRAVVFETDSSSSKRAQLIPVAFV